MTGHSSNVPFFNQVHLTINLNCSEGWIVKALNEQLNYTMFFIESLQSVMESNEKPANNGKCVIP
jgi:hypothetical protein